MSDTVTVRPRVVRHVRIYSGQPYDRFGAAYDLPADLMAVLDRADLDGVSAGSSQGLAGLQKHLAAPARGAAPGPQVSAAAS
jgi:hypothetical protein